MQVLLKKCLHDTLQQMQLPLSSFKLTRCQISLYRARVKGVKYNSGTTCLSETKYQAHSGSASCGYKASAWQGAWAKKTLYLPAKKHGKRLLQSKLEVDYLSAWGFWLKIFWLDVICIPQSQGATLTIILQEVETKKGKNKVKTQERKLLN